MADNIMWIKAVDENPPKQGYYHVENFLVDLQFIFGMMEVQVNKLGGVVEQ